MQPPITYADYMKALDDVTQARAFLKRVINTGFTIDNFDPESIDRLDALEAVKLSKEVWPVYYLETINFAGQYVQ